MSEVVPVETMLSRELRKRKFVNYESTLNDGVAQEQDGNKDDKDSASEPRQLRKKQLVDYQSMQDGEDLEDTDHEEASSQSKEKAAENVNSIQDSDDDWKENVNEDPDSGNENKEVDEFAGLSEYEKVILRRIQERNKYLIEMGFPEMVKDLSVALPMKPTPERRKQKPRKKDKTLTPKVPLPPREPSRRIRHLAALKAEEMDETIKKEEDEDEEEVDSRILGTVKVEEDGILCSNLSSNAVFNPSLDLINCGTDEFKEQLLSLKLLKFQKVTTGRVQSIASHPSAGKPIILVGDKHGNFGVWDALQEDDEKTVKQYKAHCCPLNCISVAREDPFKVYTTSHDGTIHQMDFNKGTFTNIFATEYNAAITHLTWHDEFEDHKFLVAHGDVGILDSRAGRRMQEWIDCFPRSARTVQHHPSGSQYFVVSSGTGSFKIFDLRNTNECIFVAEHPRTLSSAFFSPSGDRVVSTCADDRIRVFDSRVLCQNIPVVASYSHNNHTGRWLTSFKATWAPGRDDIFHVGSMMFPRRINFYSETKGLLLDLAAENLTTVVSAITMHPTLPIVAGANSSGKVHLFGPSNLVT